MLTSANSELRETARWAISITLQRGRLVADDEEVALQLFGCRSNWRFYRTHLTTDVAQLVSDLSNYELAVAELSLNDVKTAREFIDAIAKALRPKQSQLEERCAAGLPLKECEPSDLAGAI